MFGETSSTPLRKEWNIKEINDNVKMSIGSKVCSFISSFY